MNDQIAQGAGEDLMDMTPDELRIAINAYLDKGPDFIKYGGTSHFARPTFIGFSPEAQRVLVEEAHKRGKKAETHATTPDGLRLSIEAGIDLIQHPEVLGAARAARRAGRRRSSSARIVGSMLVNTITGEAWTEAPEGRERGGEEAAPRRRPRDRPRARTVGRAAQARPPTPATELEMRRKNAQKLIAAGAVVTARHRQLLGRGAGAGAHAEARERRTTASARSWPSRGWSSSA